MPNIHIVVTHERPHIDEIGAIWLLRRFGQDLFPGIAEAKVIFWGNGGETPDGRTALDWEDDGYLLVGVGRGRFDEHPDLLNGGARKKEECAATLVAKFLEVEDDPALEKILRYIKNDDLKGGSGSFDLGKLAQVMYQTHDQLEVITWATLALEAKYQEQLTFWTDTRNEFETKVAIQEVAGPGRLLRLAIIESDSDQIGMFYRTRVAGDNAVLIQRRSTGHILIHTNRKHGLKLGDVARLIRVAEIKTKGPVKGKLDWPALEQEGKFPQAEEWHYAAGEIQALMNGSLTATDVHPTKLSLEQVVELVKIGLNPSGFEPTREHLCKRGVCLSSVNNPCPLYEAGLGRCRSVRIKDRLRNAK